MLVILDRSKSIWESRGGNEDGPRDWETVLQFFRMLVGNTRKRFDGREGVNFALATFSEDYVIHAGFNYSFDYTKLMRLAEFNRTNDDDTFGPRGNSTVNYANTEPDVETWIPRGYNFGGALNFAQTNYGLVVDILEDAYENKAYGARDDARPLVFLVTDGSMDDQRSGIFDLNGCSAAGSGLVCGFENKLEDEGAEVVRAEACKKCWRDDLAKRMYRIGVKGLGVKGGVSVIGIGNPDNPTNAPDARTLKVFVHDDADVTRT